MSKLAVTKQPLSKKGLIYLNFTAGLTIKLFNIRFLGTKNINASQIQILLS